MQCGEVRELADSFLSEQLLVETNHEIVRHLETCPECRAEMTARRNLRDQLRSAFMKAEDLQLRPEFAAELSARLRTGGTKQSRRSFLKAGWALAAGVVLAAGGGLLVRGSGSRSRMAALARQAAGDHRNCALRFNLTERPVSLEEAGRRYGAPYDALASFELPPALDAPLQPMDRHSCVYQGRRFGHIVFRYRGAVASLLVTDGTPPAAPELQPDDGDLRVASLPVGRFVGFVASDLDREQTLRLAQALEKPLSQHFG